MKSFLRIPLFFAGFILLGLVFGYFTFKILSFSRTVEVPSIISMPLPEANEVLSKAGLYLKIEGEDFDGMIPSGRIVRQDIPAGNKVKEKRAIKVVISKGPRVSSLPSLVDETLQEAENTLMQKGVRIGRTLYVHSDTVEKGKIISQKPEPDEKLSDTVTVLVSLGPYEIPYYCPDFLNKDLETARELAARLNLILDTRGTGSLIRGQKPKPGSLIKAGDTVVLEMKEE